MEILRKKDILEVEKEMAAKNFLKFTKMDVTKLIEKTLEFYKKAKEFDEKGCSLKAYRNYFLTVTFATTTMKKDTDEYIKIMLHKETLDSMNKLEKMKNQCFKEEEEALAREEALKERERAKAELKAKQNGLSDNDLREPLKPLSGNQVNGNNNWQELDNKFIIKPDDKYDRAPVQRLTISCTELKAKLDAKTSSILLVDCRPQAEFDACTLDVGGDRLINIPPEINTMGLSAKKLGEKLSEKTKTLWDIRSTFDMLVLFDQHSRIVPTSSSTSLERVFKIIEDFDINTIYKSPPYRLKGGFDSWFMHFPYLTTNPPLYKKSQDEMSLLPSQTSLNSIDYSCTFDSTPEPEFSTQKELVPPSAAISTEPSVETIPPSSTQPPESGDVITKEPNAADLSRPKPSVPRVDRSAKPVDNNSIPSSEGSNANNRLYDQNTDAVPPRLNGSLNNADTLESRIENFNIKEDRSGKTIRSFGSISRSSSYPNLTQINGGDTLHEGRTSSNVPDFDRSKKPTQDRVSHYDRREHSVAGSNVGPGLTGLKNLGNTCYINSILQCLSNTTPLRQFFINEFGTFTSSCRNRTGCKLAEEFLFIFNNLWAGDTRYFSPNRFKEEVGKMKRTFRGYDQQDSHEFLTILIDSLHEELKKPVDNSILSGASVESGEKSWGEFIAKNQSIVSSLFYGQLKSTVICLSCQETSSTFEVFSNVSLPLPSNDYCSLRDCLDLYLKDEEIQGWHCPRCKTKRDARKKLDITKLPPVLVLHFKRFTSDGWCRKKQTTVDFPETNLNMREYTTNPESRDVKYDLYAVSNHYGTMESGHYTAYCKNKYNWYKFDDSDVTEISSSKVKSPAAYILFYISTRVDY